VVIWYNLWPLDIVCGHLVHLSHFGIFGPRKIWQPCCEDGAENLLTRKAENQVKPREAGFSRTKFFTQVES
jgi:hypothetical protein